MEDPDTVTVDPKKAWEFPDGFLYQPEGGGGGDGGAGGRGRGLVTILAEVTVHLVRLFALSS